VIGKAERQGHLDTHKAAHSLEEIAAVASVLSRAELMVRLNPLHAGTRQECDAALDHGAQHLMLPMFTTREEVVAFFDMVKGRVPITFWIPAG
jgi:citrate lyase beta subunit